MELDRYCGSDSFLWVYDRDLSQRNKVHKHMCVQKYVQTYLPRNVCPDKCILHTNNGIVKIILLKSSHHYWSNKGIIVKKTEKVRQLVGHT